MEDNLTLILNWFNRLGINPILDKLKRQLSIITSWFNANCKGVLEAVTGFGKTYIAIIAIYRLNLKYQDANVIVIVPTIKLKKDWEDHIRFFFLKNTEVFVVNTFTSRYIETKTRYKCTLLVCDEVHNYLSDNALQFNQTIRCTDFEMFLGLSATLDDKEKETLLKMGIPIIDTVSMSEAQRFNYISNYQVYNFGINLSTVERENYDKINDIHNSNYGKFLYFVESDKNWELIRACAVGNDVTAKVGYEYKTGREWRNWYAETMEWNGEKDHPWSPTNISKYANQWNWAMRERKNFLHKHSAKIEATKLIIDHLKVPTITFSESTDFTNELTHVLGNTAMAFHSNIDAGFTSEEVIVKRKTLKAAKDFTRENSGEFRWDEEEKAYIIKYKKQKKISGASLKRLAISRFEAGEIQTICTAKALDEGFNVEGIGCAIICSGSSKKRQYIQRMGRSLRFIEGKTAKIINLYIKGTQDETWLKKRQKGDPGIIWVDNVENIK